MTDTGTDTDTDESADHAHEAVPASASPGSWWHWRRLTRGRMGPALAAALAGAVLATAGMAWGTETGPFTDDRACWGALTQSDVATLFSGKTDIETSELPITDGGIRSGGQSGQCLLHSPRGHRITARFHQLDLRLAGASDRWADEYLSARMTPLGSDFLGMASDTRAWAAIPEGCNARPGRYDREGPLVMDIETGWTSYGDAVDATERDQLARTVVKLVNDYLRDQGCEGTVTDPVDQLPKPARFERERADAICGIKGLRLPDRRDAYLESPWVTKGAGPVRTCDRDVIFDRPTLRLMTIEDPRLSVIFKDIALTGGKQIRSPGGRGFIRNDFGLFQTACQTGDVTFLVRSENGRNPERIRSLLPDYVTKEADRIGCGPLRITLPG